MALPRPEALAGRSLVLPHDAAALRRWGRDTAGLPVVWDVWRRRITCFLSTWNLTGDRAAGDPADAHDQRLGIVRSRTDPTMALLNGVVQSLDRFCQECTGAREFREQAIIPAALIEMWQWLLQDPDPVRPSVDGKLAEVHGRAPDAIRRWAVGHQLLATLTQGQIVSLLAYERLQPSPSVAQTRQFLQRTTRLCLAGAAACRFTADLTHGARLQSRHLAQELEPDAPQAVETRSMDHRHLTEIVTRLRPLLAQAGRACPEEHAAMSEAISRFCRERRQLQVHMADAPGLLRSAPTLPTAVPDTAVRPASWLVATASPPPVKTLTASSLERLLPLRAGSPLLAHP